MNTSLRFAATFKMDPNYNVKKTRGEKEQKQLDDAIAKYGDLLKDHDIELTFSAKHPTDFDVNDSMWVDGYENKMDSTTRHYVGRKIATNPFVLPFAALGLAIVAPVSLVKPDLKEMRTILFEAVKQPFSESVEKFVKRAFEQIKTEMDASKAKKSESN